MIYTNKRIFIFILQIFLVCSFTHASVRVVNNMGQLEAKIEILSNVEGTYVSAKDISKIFSSRSPFFNKDRMKMVLYFTDTRIKVTSNTGYVLVDENVYHMPTHARYNGEDIFLPAEAFFYILQKTVLPGLIYDRYSKQLEMGIIDFNMTSVDINQKANGTILTIHTNKRFSDGYISSFLHDNGWFYLTVQEGLVDSLRVKKTDTRGVVTRVSAHQFEESAQIAFRLRSEIIGHEVYQSADPKAIVVTLRTPFDKSADRVNNIRKLWRLDTVVLDAGHGGKDGGTVGRKGTLEKDVVLDITKRLGLMLEKKTNINVVYTRDEDVFIPLWKRTQLANESKGKIFVSIHVNSNPNRSAKGFETYLLSEGKSNDAIELAARENAVIKMEEHSGKKYKELTGENLIMATMAQSMFMKESEDLASLIQKELGKRLDSPNRGVKQAGFVVLIGASMPNVLIETGFLSNPTEEARMRKPSYRKIIATGIFNAIIKFRTMREELLAEG